MNAFIPKGLLDSDQQMVGEYTQKDVGLYSPFELMKDGALGQGTLHGPKGLLSAGQ